MKTDKKTLIDEQIAQIVSLNAVIQLHAGDFERICPHPCMVYVAAKSCDEAVELLRREVEEFGDREWDGAVQFIRGTQILAEDLTAIENATPRAARFRRGIDKGSPGSDDIEIWLFLEEKQPEA